MKNSKALHELDQLEPKNSKLKKVTFTKHAEHPDDYEEDLKARLEEAKQAIQMEKESTIRFPREVFPEKLQSLLEVFYQSSGFPPEYYFASLLSVASLCIGNKYQVRIKTDFAQSAILYMCIVGKSGMGKSRPMKTMFSPIFSLQKEFIKQFNVIHRLWKQDKEQAYQDKVPFEKEEPQLQKLIFEYATIESIWDINSISQHGLALVDEEISGWVASFNQYSGGKGPELAFWLKNYDNPNIIPIYRKGQPDKFIYNSCVTICGGIQPGVVKALAEGDKTESGFFARFLLTFAEKEEVPGWNDNQPDVTVFQQYKDIIKFLYKLPSKIPDEIPHTDDVEKISILFEEKARMEYISFYEMLRGRMNSTPDDKEFSQLSKFRGACLRFALILEMLHFAVDHYEDKDWLNLSKDDKLKVLSGHKIGMTAIHGAILLTEYYIATSMNTLSAFDNLLMTYKKEVREWYIKLPETFKTSYAIELGSGLGIKRSTVFSYMNDSKLFKKIDTGLYGKTILA